VNPRRFILTITSPGGVVFDVKLDAGNIGSVSTSSESDLGILSHGDLSLTIDNSDGAIEDFLLNAGPSDTYEVSLTRQRYNGTEWDRIFGGVLDLPYSLSFDDVARTAKVVAYSYSKQLERTPADGTAGATTVLRRTLASKTATITVDTSTLLFLAGSTEAADLEVGDVVRLNDGQRIEDFTIDRILDSSNASTTSPASANFSGAYTEVITPFYHDKSPTSLLTLVAQEAGVSLNDRNLGTPLADFPIATPYSQAGLNLTGNPHSIIPLSGVLTVTYAANAGQGLNRKTSTGPTATWADGPVSNLTQLDWTPFHDTQPGTLASGNPTFNICDSGYYAPDHLNNDIFRNEGSGVGNPTILYRFTGGTNSFTSLGNSSIIGGVFVRTGHVVDPNGSGVYVSCRNTAGSREFRYWNGTFNTISTSVSGGLQIIRYPPNGRLLVMVDDLTNDILLWNLPPLARTLGRTIKWLNATDRILPWTMRSWGNTTYGGALSKRWFTFLFQRYGETWVAVYDARGPYSDWSFVAAYRVSGETSPQGFLGTPSVIQSQSYQTVMKDSTGEEYIAGFAGKQWFVLSTSYAGVIRYANFKDSSCAKAARDIAIILDSVVNFDPFKVMTILNRKALGSGDVVKDLGVPLTSTRYPISELYRASVTVSGTDSNGGSINETQGDSGDSARRLTISSDLITTPGMALACALTTLSFVSQIREQRNVTIIDDGDPLAVFDRVSLDGREWFIYRLETDIEEQTHTMTLLELEP